MSPNHFNATEELTHVRKHQRKMRRRSYHRSRLTKWRSELVAMRKAGGSFRELTIWLRRMKRIKMTHTTVMRYLKKLPELKED